MKFKYILFLFSFLFLFVGCSIADSEDESRLEIYENDTIKIGVMYALSEKNDGFGRVSLDIVNMTINNINSNGGINGKLIELVIEDSSCSLEDGKIKAQKLVNLGVKYIVGGLCSDSTLGAVLVTDPNEIILFSPTASSAKLSYVGDYLFRTVPSDTSSATKLANIIYNRGFRDVGIISEVTSFTSSLKIKFIEEFESLGGTVLVSESFISEDVNISKQILGIKNSEIDSLFFLTQDEDKYRFLVQNLIDFEIDVPLFTSETINSEYAREGFEIYLNNSVFTGVYVSRDWEDSVNLINLVKDYYGYDITTDYSFYYLSSNYDLINILTSAMKNCGYDDTNCVKDNLYLVKNYSGVIGDISINGLGDSELESSVYTFNGVDFDISNE